MWDVKLNVNHRLRGQRLGVCCLDGWNDDEQGIFCLGKIVFTVGTFAWDEKYSCQDIIKCYNVIYVQAALKYSSFSHQYFLGGNFKSFTETTGDGRVKTSSDLNVTFMLVIVVKILVVIYVV